MAAAYWTLGDRDEFHDVMLTHKHELLQQHLTNERFIHKSIRHKALAAMQGMDDYNQYLAPSLGGVEPLIVDCSQTKAISFYFVAARPASRTSVSRFTVSYEWKNPANSKPASTRSKVLTAEDSRGTYDLERDRVRRVYTAYLPLSNSRRVDGRWTLTIRHREHELHKEIFDVRGCSGTGVPDWYQEGKPTNES